MVEGRRSVGTVGQPVARAASPLRGRGPWSRASPRSSAPPPIPVPRPVSSTPGPTLGSTPLRSTLARFPGGAPAVGRNCRPGIAAAPGRPGPAGGPLVRPRPSASHGTARPADRGGRSGSRRGAGVVQRASRRLRRPLPPWTPRRPRARRRTVRCRSSRTRHAVPDLPGPEPVESSTPTRRARPRPLSARRSWPGNPAREVPGRSPPWPTPRRRSAGSPRLRARRTASVDPPRRLGLGAPLTRPPSGSAPARRVESGPRPDAVGPGPVPAARPAEIPAAGTPRSGRRAASRPRASGCADRARGRPADRRADAVLSARRAPRSPRVDQRIRRRASRGSRVRVLVACGARSRHSAAR